MALGDLPTGEDKRVRVRDMFDRIAPRYDALNRVMSVGMDQRWRRRALAMAGVGPGDRVLDLACGTGDLCEQVRALGAEPIGADFARQMLAGAQARGVEAAFVQGDAAQLPDYFVDALELAPEAHLAMQAALQPFVDNAISKTINVPADFDFEAFRTIYTRAYQLGLKGCTTFRPNPVTGAVLAAEGEGERPAGPHCCGLDRESD